MNPKEPPNPHHDARQEAVRRLTAAIAGADPDAAAQACQRLTRLEPDQTSANLIIARTYWDAGQPAQAEHILRDAIAASPGDSRPHLLLASFLTQGKRFEEAVAPLARGVALDPHNSAARHSYGWVLATLGRKQAATEQLMCTLAIDNRNAAAHYLLATLKRYERDDPHLAQMRNILDSGSLPARDRSRVLYALGRATEQIGEYAQAFSCYREANHLRRAGSGFDLTAARRSIEGLIGAFTPTFLSSVRGAGDPSRLPVFLVGMPRCGSTLIEQILASHPECDAAGEIMDFSQAHIRVVRPLTDSDRPWTGQVSAIPLPAWREIGAGYANGLAGRFSGARRVTDKQLLNYSLVGVIHLALPNAAIIHCARDPLDTCISCFATAFRNEYYGFTCDLTELGETYKLYSQLMQHWQAVLPGRMLRIDYEALVTQPETQIRRLLAHVGLPWADECLQFHRTARPVATSSRGQVTEPIYDSSIGRWKRFAEYIDPLRKSLGS